LAIRIEATPVPGAGSSAVSIRVTERLEVLRRPSLMSRRGAPRHSLLRLW
jgi:hypothetical protein